MQDWRNEAAWVYLRGLLAISDKEVEKSQHGNAKRVHVNQFPWLKELIELWVFIAEHPEYNE